MRLSEILLRATLPLLFALPAHALQVVEGRDGVAVEAILSIKEPTRIRIEGAPITDVFGNIQSSNCAGGSAPGASAPSLAGGTTPIAPSPPSTAINPGGEVVLECDRDKGEIYILPIGESGKPVNLFVSSAQATYTLVLRRADTPADTIVIRDRTVRSGFAGSGSFAAASAPLGSSAHYVRALKALLVAMASDRAPADVRIDELDQPIQLWAEARFSLLRRFESRDLIGERYQLTNISEQPMVLAEQEFDRPDSTEGGQVLAVAIENPKLRPGQSTNVYVIRRGGTR